MGREMGGRFKRAGIFVYLWVIHVRFGRKQQHSVKQLSFNKKISNFKKKKRRRKNCVETQKTLNSQNNLEKEQT